MGFWCLISPSWGGDGGRQKTQVVDIAPGPTSVSIKIVHRKTRQTDLAGSHSKARNLGTSLLAGVDTEQTPGSTDEQRFRQIGQSSPVIGWYRPYFLIDHFAGFRTANGILIALCNRVGDRDRRSWPHHHHLQ
jgi:hypothetical protein